MGFWNGLLNPGSTSSEDRWLWNAVVSDFPSWVSLMLAMVYVTTFREFCGHLLIINLWKHLVHGMLDQTKFTKWIYSKWCQIQNSPSTEPLFSPRNVMKDCGLSQFGRAHCTTRFSQKYSSIPPHGCRMVFLGGPVVTAKNTRNKNTFKKKHEKHVPSFKLT